LQNAFSRFQITAGWARVIARIQQCVPSFQSGPVLSLLPGITGSQERSVTTFSSQLSRSSLPHSHPAQRTHPPTPQRGNTFNARPRNGACSDVVHQRFCHPASKEQSKDYPPCRRDIEHTKIPRSRIRVSFFLINGSDGICRENLSLMRAGILSLIMSVR